MNKRMSLVGLLLLFPLLLDFCGEDKSIDTLFPLQEGMSWEYENSKIKDGVTIDKMKIVAEVLKEDEVGGEKVIPVIRKMETTSGINHTIIFYYVKDGQGIYLLAMQIGQQKSQEISGKMPYKIKMPIKLGESWGNDQKGGNIESINDTITVPAGTFYNCVKVAMQVNGLRNTFWYAPKIGEVKAIFHTSKDYLSVEQLVSYKK